MHVRDSKNKQGSQLALSSPTWEGFVAHITK
ncbi:DUF397 domain-containing protein [Streptomyces sp. NBC_00847]|nr:DUF397 domain-containing protein [Streptomyces sp. NBC_00847]